VFFYPAYCQYHAVYAFVHSHFIFFIPILGATHPRLVEQEPRQVVDFVVDEIENAPNEQLAGPVLLLVGR